MSVINDSSQENKKYPAFRPVHLALFPVLDNLNAVVDLGISQLPIMTPNALVSLLGVYHNTLIKQLSETQANNTEA